MMLLRHGPIALAVLFGCHDPHSPTLQPDASTPLGPFKAVSAGTSRTCAIKADGTLWCWGTGAMTAFAASNGSSIGGLAVPDENVPLTTDAPAQVTLIDQSGNPIADGYSAVAVGLFKECAITNQNALVCFVLPDTHAEVVATNIVSASVGDTGLCAITAEGNGTCVGTKAHFIASYPYGEYQREDFTQDLGGGWASVTSGRGVATATDSTGTMSGIASVGLKLDGTAWSWAPNGSPIQIPGSWASITVSQGPAIGIRADHVLASADGTVLDSAPDWASVVAGNTHVCATKLDGTAYCWGNADLGRVGLDPPVSSTGPASPLPGIWKSLTAGGTHSCGIQTDGTLWCWGSDNTLGGIRTQPTAVSLSGVTQTDVGACSACAIANGSLKCWGCGEAEQLGSGMSSAQTPASVDTTHAWTTLSVGHSDACAIRDDSTLWCWGSQIFPQPSPLMQLFPGSGWESVAVGSTDTCAIKSDHTLYCRGGQVAGTNWAQVATGKPWLNAGGSRTCAITTAGELWCWGVIETDVGTDYYSATPVQVAGTWLSLSLKDEDRGAGAANCAIKSDHTLWCGGGFAQQVPGSNWISVSAASMSCGIQADHSLWCWPDPLWTNNTPMPVQIAGAWQAVSTHNSGERCSMTILGYSADWCPNVCAIANDGSLSCWGVDNRGQVGDSSSWKPVPTRFDF